MTTPTSSTPVLLRGASLAARVGGRTLFEGLDVEVRAGELVALTGPNGSGKSTLLRILLSLMRPSSGSVERAEGLSFGYVPQLDPGDPGLPFPSSSVVAQGLPRRAWRGLGREGRTAISEALGIVGFRPPPSRRYTRLSGGERRRVLFARALVGKPDVLALDEPTAGVDAEGEREVVDLVKGRLAEGGCAALWVCHALPSVEHAADRVIRLGVVS